MAQKNRKCFACETKYSYCPSCSRVDALKPSWYNEFCSEECMTVWTTATKYNMNRLTKSEAKEIISNVVLKPIESYTQCIQKDLNVILAEEKKFKKFHKKVEPVVEEVQIIEPVVEVVLEQVAEDTTAHEVVLTEENNKAL